MTPEERNLIMTLMDLLEEGISGKPQYDFRIRAKTAIHDAQVMLLSGDPTSPEISTEE